MSVEDDADQVGRKLVKLATQSAEESHLGAVLQGQATPRWSAG